MSARPPTLSCVTTLGRAQTQRSAVWVEQVDRPEAWATEHLWLLESIFALFDRDGDWPRIESVQRVLADSDPARAVAVAQLAIDIPSELGARHVDRFALTTRALAHCPGAASLLSLFVGVIGRAAAAYRASDDEHPAVLSGFEVKQALGLDDRAYVLVSRLVFAEPWFFGGGGGNVQDDWQYNVRAEVLLAEDIHDITDYLDVVARYRFGSPEIALAPPAASQHLVIGAVRDWLRKRDPTVRDYLLVAIASAVVAGVVLWLLLG
jgi:hypothetical protein